MKAKDRRELYRKESKERHEENFSNSNDSGRFRGIFDPAKKAGVKFWSCKEDDHEIYIVPYVVGKQHPKLKEGKSDFALSVFVHRGVGINEDSFICLNRTYRQKCPICEYQAELRDDDKADEEDIKALNPTKRTIYNIVCLDTAKEEEKGVQVFDVSNWLFTLPLEDLAHKKKGGGEVAYADIDEGKIISFKKKGSKRSTEFTAFEFKDRPDIPDEILDSAVCLDELLYIPTYEEVSEAFWETKEEERTSAQRKPKEEVDTTSAKEPSIKEPSISEKKEDDVHTDDMIGSSVEECPSGAVFGKDFNAYEECRPCEVRRQCRDKKDEMDEAEEKAKATKAAPTVEKKKLTRREK
jgi:hypothetical protein